MDKEGVDVVDALPLLAFTSAPHMKSCRPVESHSGAWETILTRSYHKLILSETHE